MTLPIMSDAGPCTRARSGLLAALTDSTCEPTTLTELISSFESEGDSKLARMLHLAKDIAVRRCTTASACAA